MWLWVVGIRGVGGMVNVYFDGVGGSWWGGVLRVTGRCVWKWCSSPLQRFLPPGLIRSSQISLAALFPSLVELHMVHASGIQRRARFQS